MTRRRGRSWTGDSFSDRKSIISEVFCLCLSLLFPSVAEAGLYTSSDQIVLLTPANIRPLLVNSSAATVVEFYASWCGHCVAFSPIYKSLARDIREWKPAVDLAAFDCGSENNYKDCTSYGVKGYPTLKFFHAYSNANSTGQGFQGFPRDVRGLRHRIIDALESHQEHWPPACPPLEPTSQAEIDSFFETNKVRHLALIFEDSKSYVGREVILDLLQFENIAVRRVLKTEVDLVTKLGVTEFPSCYLYYPGGNFSRLIVNIEARMFYTYNLQRLSGVVRSGKPADTVIDVIVNGTTEKWRPFNRTRVYMADLESTLHYSLRVELAAHAVVTGDALTALKQYISVLAKYFPGRPVVVNLLKSVNLWLQNQTGDEVSYEAFRKLLDNTAQTSDAALPEGVRWVACQGTRHHTRRYPCGMWTLFHVLTVQAKNAGASAPQEVLGAFRSYIGKFFGCRQCAEHFENMAKESLAGVNTMSEAVLWLWERHNQVNNRVAGELSEDPSFPKIQWPSPQMCPACHSVRSSGEHKWKRDQVFPFLMSYYSSTTIASDYLDEESHVLEKIRAKLASEARAEEDMKSRRIGRHAVDFPASPQPSLQEEAEEEEEQEQHDEEDDVGETLQASEAPVAPALVQAPPHKKPVIVGLKMRNPPEDIVDLDSFVNQHYKAKALQMAAASRVKQRTLQKNEEQDPGTLLGLGLDARIGMVDLQPMEPEVNERLKRRQKRELAFQNFREDAEMNSRGRWMSMLNVGFSKIDISLCVILYFLSSTCLLAMYLFFKTRLRIRRAKVLMP
ncbi:sulfhydryl oxidase 1 [Synchiropus splendidus]|uniref:sulfhydryl oxidase 1 n=1 Tax=Synchiropus splendidus TaxID=270530 RepID=UPI00237D4817|nr:sulfhydryl oxidase 1 [Synchiropus splendidus]